jgi:hypothetical protein
MTWPAAESLAVVSGNRSTHLPTWKNVARMCLLARYSAIWEVYGSFGPSSNVSATTRSCRSPRYGYRPNACEYGDRNSQ